MAGLLWRERSFVNKKAALALALGFHGYLRAGEICKLRCNDFCFRRDPRLSTFAGKPLAGLVIKEAKTRKDQFVPIYDRLLQRRLRMWNTRGLSQGGNPKAFGFTYKQLQRLFHRTLQRLDLHQVGFTLHGLRHGGATSDWLGGIPFADIKMTGRWESEKSC